MAAAERTPHAALREDLKALRGEELINDEEFAGMKKEALTRQRHKQYSGSTQSGGSDSAPDTAMPVIASTSAVSDSESRT